jgi:hypothetical protein
MADQYSGLIARTTAGIGPALAGGEKSRCRRRLGDHPLAIAGLQAKTV